MIFGLGRQPELLDKDSICWMLDVFEWAAANIDIQNVQRERALIYPNNEYFPGRENSAEGMASLIFSQVTSYFRMDKLHCELLNESGNPHAVAANLEDGGATLVPREQKITFSYHTHTLNNPEVLIASFAHQLAYFIVSSSQELPPGGEENLPHVAELLAVFMGFGVIMANTANTQKIRSCGSCSGPAVERESFLSQYDITYALAIFCVMKKITAKPVTQHLKKTLRTYFKKSHQEIISDKFLAHEKLEHIQSVYFSIGPDVIQGNK